jgi:hypothetical protein
MRFDAARSMWTLWRMRASGRWQREDVAPTPDVGRLLDELDADRDGAFWG